MADVDAIIRQILEASRAKGGRALPTERVYGDVPILMRGSQMASYLPEPIRRMRALGRSPQARAWSDAHLFVEQARLMADYTDDCPYQGSFMSYFPTYDAMSDRQLRGYFTWRTHVRQGQIEPTSASFAYVYLYELINGIGVEPGEKGFRAIESFWQSYRVHEPAIDRYVRPWLVDYVVYHDLEAALATPYLDLAHDRAVGVLARAEAESLAAAPARGRKAPPRAYARLTERDDELLAALDELSTYRIREGRLYRDEPEAVRSVTGAVFDRLARHSHSSRTQGFVAGLFGTRHAMPHLMFASAVFYPAERHPDCVVELAETRRYVCRGGIWTCDALHDGGGRSARLGQILRAVDRRLRAGLDYPHPLKDHADPKYLAQIIDREVSAYLTWRAAHAPVRVDIDLSKLAGIRSAAAATREALLVDEERADEPAAERDAGAAPNAEAVPAATPKPAPTAATVPAVDLTAEERALLEALLAGRTADAAGSDLLVDAINEKFLDLVGDTVLEFDETGAPALVEDYVDDVAPLLRDARPGPDS